MWQKRKLFSILHPPQSPSNEPSLTDENWTHSRCLISPTVYLVFELPSKTTNDGISCDSYFLLNSDVKLVIALKTGLSMHKHFKQTTEQS